MRDASIEPDFIFSDEERNRLHDALNAIRVSPYSSYGEFNFEIAELVNRGCVPENFMEVCERKAHVDVFQDPYVYLKNCPVDRELPELGNERPVVEKRAQKRTYVAEGFLELYARLSGQTPIGYANVNDGDIFQDIYPIKDMYSTQSQKALEDIYFHKDLANHFVRPDWVNIVGLRASGSNQIYTCFVKNADLLNSMSDKLKSVLRAEEFYTPYDDLTTSSSNVKLGSANNHPVLGGAAWYDIRFFENRTVGLTERAKVAVAELCKKLHELKKPILILRGDFIGAANNECIHCKLVGALGEPAEVRRRWLMKTVNVRSLVAHLQHLRGGVGRVING
jgi:hypothetical protein